MRRVAKWLGRMLLVAGAGLVLLGVASWPPGGLMFALPFVFLFPGAFLVVLGAILVWLGGRSGSRSPQARDES